MIDVDTHVIEPPDLFPGVGFAPDAEPIPYERYLEHLERIEIEKALLHPTKVLYAKIWDPLDCVKYMSWVMLAFPDDRFVKIPPISLGWEYYQLKELFSGEEPAAAIAVPRAIPNPGTLRVLTELNIPLILHPVGGMLKYSPDLILDHTLHSPLEGLRTYAEWAQRGIFRLFPTLRILFLETGAWWLGPMLRRLHSHGVPSDALGVGQVYVGAEISQTSHDTTTTISPGFYVIGSDFPHFDMQNLSDLPPSVRNYLTQNARSFLGWT